MERQKKKVPNQGGGEEMPGIPAGRVFTERRNSGRNES